MDCELHGLYKVLEIFRESLIQEELFHEVFTQNDQRSSSPEQSDIPQPTAGVRQSSSEEILVKIEDVVEHLLLSLSKKEAPSLSFTNTRTWDNIKFQAGCGLQMINNTSTSIRFDNSTSLNNFALTIKILSEIYSLLKVDAYCTKRDLFYKDVELYGNQRTVDNIINNISCMLEVPRWQLHVLATSKGCMAGSLQFRDADGNMVDCSKTENGVLIPNHVTNISNLTTQARFILVVEKDATFQTLLDDGFCRKYSYSLLMTGKGFPDVNTRLMLRKLWDKFHLPIFALVDADPHGIEIMEIYKHGSRALSFETPNLSVPSLRWLGVLPSDVEKLQIPSDTLLKLSDKDVDKAKELLCRQHITDNAPMRNEIELIMKRGLKAEIECLTSLGPSFLTDVYLQNKILSNSWI